MTAREGVARVAFLPVSRRRRMVLASAVALTGVLAGAPRGAVANTGAAEGAAGGLRLVRAPRVSIREERLQVGTQRISVDYVFVNEADAPISTEVAFPVPDYRYVTVRYRPVAGYDAPHEWSPRKVFAAACASPQVRETARGELEWIGYILTTANTWKTPVRRFELRVDVPKRAVASFCWDGPVRRDPDGSLHAEVADFVPRRELEVYYFFE